MPALMGTRANGMGVTLTSSSSAPAGTRRKRGRSSALTRSRASRRTSMSAGMWSIGWILVGYNPRRILVTFVKTFKLMDMPKGFPRVTHSFSTRKSLNNGGKEVVYDFATMERSSFSYESEPMFKWTDPSGATYEPPSYSANLVEFARTLYFSKLY